MSAEEKRMGQDMAEAMDPGAGSGFSKFASFTSEAARAVGDSLSNLAGSLTGKTLEDRIQEYSEVYGEILLHINDRMDQLERRQSGLEEVRLSPELIRRLKEMKEKDPDFFTVETQHRLRSEAKFARIFSILAFFLSLGALFAALFR
ncbi:MAG: hypothetical protein KDK23_13250 [Leptospiraceae bacterium]|nr:hypothetical protein [Leptospiraceae bacterium]